MGVSLFNYLTQIDDIIAGATDEDGVIDYDSIKDELEALQLAKDEKIDNCISFIKSRTAMAEALKNEKMAINRRQQQAENEAQRVKEYLAFCLDGSKWESTAGKVSYRRSESVEVTNLLALPEEYQKWKLEADKAALKADLKEGAIIDGAHLIEKINTIIK